MEDCCTPGLMTDSATLDGLLFLTTSLLISLGRCIGKCDPLVAAALLFFVSRHAEGDFDHGDRLSPLQLREDETRGGEPDPAAGPAAPGEDPGAARPDPAHA